MNNILSYLFDTRNRLTREQAREAIKQVTSGAISEAEIASFLTIFLMRPLDPLELQGFREGMLDQCVPVPLNGFDVIDVCGTGGDGKHTFNISTLSAFVLAGAGVKVVKHGNYGVSSPSGSSNMFEKMGYILSNNQDKLLKELDRANICYLHAPLFHPAMKHVGPVRRALKLKTFFNILGPLVNPARPQCQLAGVYDQRTMELYQGVFDAAGIRYTVVHNIDGYDEISLTNPFLTIENGVRKEYEPADLGMPQLSPADIMGAESVDDAFILFRSILEGRGTAAQNNVVIANSAMAMKCYFANKSLSECIALSREALLSGKALSVLKTLINLQ